MKSRFLIIAQIFVIFLIIAYPVNALTNELGLGKNGLSKNTINQRTLGSDSAPVTLEVFFNYYDYLSMKWHNVVMPEVIGKYVKTGKVKLVARHFPIPLDYHPNLIAILLADGAECAAQQNKYFEFIDYAFKHQNELNSINSVKNIARQIGLNTARFDLCFTTSSAHEYVEQDLTYAYSIMSEPITSPTFFVNGYEIKNNVPPSEMYNRINELIKPTDSTDIITLSQEGESFFHKLKEILL